MDLACDLCLGGVWVIVGGVGLGKDGTMDWLWI